MNTASLGVLGLPTSGSLRVRRDQHDMYGRPSLGMARFVYFGWPTVPLRTASGVLRCYRMLATPESECETADTLLT